MAGPNDFQAITTAILDQTSDDTVIVAMLVGAGLESDWRITAPGGGAFQIISGRPSVSGIGTAVTTQIDADVKFMLPRYAAAAVDHAADKEGPDKYASIAHDAERPAVPYQQSQGEAKVSSVYTTVVQDYGKVSATGQSQVKTIIGGNIGLGFLGPTLAFLGQLTDIRLWRSLGWVLLGIVVLGAGLLLWLKGSGMSPANFLARGAE
jgi:hypothetical protein